MLLLLLFSVAGWLFACLVFARLLRLGLGLACVLLGCVLWFVYCGCCFVGFDVSGYFVWFLGFC